MKYAFTITPIDLNSLIKEEKTFEFPSEEKAKYWLKHFDSLVTFLNIHVSDIKQIVEESDKAKVLEKIIINFYAETDGDFGFRNDEFSDCIEKMSNKDKEYSYTKPHCFSFRINYNCDGKADEYDAKMQARDFIENIVKCISFGHLFLMKDFYDMYDKARNWLFHSPDEQNFCWSLSGNYEGTKLHISREYEEK